MLRRVRASGRTLAGRLDEVARDVSQTREADLQAEIRGLRHSLYVSQRNLAFLQGRRMRDERDLRSRVQIEVTDKGYDLIFEIDHLKTQLQQAQFDIEHQHDRGACRVVSLFVCAIAHARVFLGEQCTRSCARSTRCSSRTSRRRSRR